MFACRCRRLTILVITSATLLGACASAQAAVTHATVALVPRHPTALAAYATAVTTPGSPRYHHYLSVAGFARRFGRTAPQVDRVKTALTADGLTPGAVSANGLTLPVTSAGAGASKEDFFGALDRGRAPGPTGFTRIFKAGGISGLVQGVIGLDDAPPSASVIVHRARRPSSETQPIALDAQSAPATGPQPCAAAQSAGSGGGAHTAGQIASTYGLSNYYAAGDEGQNVTIAVYELEPFSGSDIAAYQSCYATNADVTTVPVDGGAGVGSGSGEAAMDIEDLIGLAPQASIRVYEGPDTAAGAYATYSRIVSDDSAQVISTSWGLCEALEGAAPAVAQNTLFEEAAVQGQSVLASSGDEGSDDCGDGQRAVDDPAGQPWVTGVGATSLQGSADVAWDNGEGATGGGVSHLWGRPAYQNHAALPQSAVSCGASGHACREVPDLSVDGDPTTGYVAYYLGAWRTVGGTSVSAPTVAALIALADASPACAGHRIGFLNPALYRAAAGSYATDFRDVTSGANTFDSVAGYAAGPGYDMASGLGAPTAALGSTLCRGAVVQGRSDAAARR